MTKSVLLATLVLVFTGSSIAQQTEKPAPTRQEIIDRVENGIVYYSCRVDPALMKCAGFDPEKQYDQCVLAIRTESPACIDSLRSSLPEFPSREESQKYNAAYTKCVITRVTTAKGLFFRDVEKCADSASTAP